MNKKRNRKKNQTQNKEILMMATFSSLPDSVIVQILSYLDYSVIIRSTRVCTRWHRLCYDPSLWKNVYIRDKHASKIKGDTITRLIPHRSNLISSVTLTNCTGVGDDTLIHLSSNCPNLRKIFLTGCNLITDSGILALAHNCNVLKTVSIPSKNISEAAMITLVQNNPRIRQLCAYSIAVTQNTMDAISNGCPDLQTFIVDEASLENDQRSSDDVLTDKMVHILARGCRKLRDLTLRYNQVLVTNRGLGSLAENCLNLESFVIDYCDSSGITDNGVCAMAQLCRNLKCLNISNGIITDVSLVVIAAHLPCLEDLSLEFSDISDLGILAVMSKCEKISSLIVHNSTRSGEDRITDRSALVLAKFASCDFRSLGLGFADITNEGLKTICCNVDLFHLSISGCYKITFEGLKSCFNCLDCLWNLDVSFTDIVLEEEQLLEIGDSLPFLHSLDITDCFGISGESIKAFKEKFPDCKVSM